MNNSFLNTENFKYLISFVFNDIKQKTDYDISNNSKYINVFKKLVQTIHEKNMNKRVSTQYLNNLVIDKCVPFIIKQLDKENSNSKINYNDVRNINISNRPMSSKESKSNSSENDFSYLKLQNDINSNSNPNPNYTPNIINNVSGISSRNGEKIDFSSKMKQFQDDRGYDNGMMNKNPNSLKSVNEIMGKNSQDEEKIDVMKKMQELQNDRNYTNQNDNMNAFESNTNMENIRNNENLQNVNNQNVEIDNTFLQQLYENNQTDQTDYNQNTQTDYNQNNQNNQTNYNQNTNNLDDYDENDAGDSIESSYQNLNLNISDKSNNNKLPTYDSSIDNLIDKQQNENKEDQTKELSKQIYQPTNFNYGRKKRIICIDVSNNLPDISNGIIDGVSWSKKAIDNIGGDYWSNFRVNLKEEFIIDKVSDIYLESITINRPAQATNFSNLYFVLDIDEFNIKTNTNNAFMGDKFVIPNENTESFGNNKIMKYHKKSNYVAQINPTKLSSLTFTITNENNESVNTNININTTPIRSVDIFYPSNTRTAIELSDMATNEFSVNDAIYNGNNNLVGIVTNVNFIPGDTINSDITFGGGTLVDLGAGEELFLSTFKTTITIDAATQINTTIAIAVNNDPTSLFPINTHVYLGNGSYVGKVTSSSTDGINDHTITISDGTQIYLSANDVLYSGNPLGTVFSSNSKSNRMIMEFVLITK